MQRALLIDEIIRHIFHFSAEDGLATLNAIAMCCRTWEGPGLDFLWTRLSSIVPLLQLIPGVSLVDGMYVFEETHPSPDLSRFHSYASRVKHISHQRKVQVHPAILCVLKGQRLPSTHPIVMLPSLRSAKLSTSNFDEIQACLSLSGALNKLDIDFGFKTRSNEHIAQYLRDVVKTVPGLLHLSVRGSITDSLMGLVSSMYNLHTLSLRLGSSLTMDALLAILGFPNLSELEIHVGHIDADDLSTAFAEKNTLMFPSLTQLRIRAHTPVLALIIDKIPIDALHTLYIEAEETADVPAAWNPVLKNISTRAPNSLRDLTIEHHVEIDDIELESVSNANTTGTSPGPPKTNNPIPFSDLRTLGSLRYLSKFVLDTTLPPAIYDEDLTALVKGWPELRYLDLGSASPVSQAKSLTFRSLCTLATKTPKLVSLVVAPDLKGCDHATIPPDTPSQHTLTSLTFACAPAPDPKEMARCLRRLFPTLLEVDGLPEHEEEWSEVRNALRSCFASSELLSS